MRTKNGISKPSKATPPRNRITRKLKVDPPAKTEEEGPTTPLLTAITLNRIAIVRKLLEKNADPNQEGGIPTVSAFGATELITALYYNREDEVDRLLDAGADVNECGFAHAMPGSPTSGAGSPTSGRA